MFENERGFEPYGSNNIQKANTNSLVTPPIENPSHSIGSTGRSQKRPTEMGNVDEGVARSESATSAIDPTALDKALREFEEHGRRRDMTPGSSPSRKRQRIYGDR